MTENTPEKSLKMSKFDMVGYQEMAPMISSPSEIRSQESIIQKTRNSNKDNNFSSFKTNEIVFCQNEDSFMNQNVEEYF